MIVTREPSELVSVRESDGLWLTRGSRCQCDPANIASVTPIDVTFIDRVVHPGEPGYVGRNGFAARCIAC